MQDFKVEDSCAARRLAGTIRRSWVSRTTIRSLSVLLVATLLVACGSSSNNNATTPVADSEVVSSAAIAAFAAIGEDVRDTTPLIGEAANTTLDEWAEWQGGSEYAVFNKLFATSSAQSIHTPVEFLEELMYIIQKADNSDTNVWDEEGTIYISGEDPESPGITHTLPVTVALVTGDIALPTFFQDKVASGIQQDMTWAMNRIISFNYGDENDGWEIVVAIGEDDLYYYLIASAVHDFYGETQTFVAYMERTTETMTLYYASADSGASGVYTKWTGNLLDDWFSVAQVTDACGGNQEVVGGGSISGTMAFKSRNHDDNAYSTDVYYLTGLTANNIVDGTDPGVSPTGPVTDGPTEGTEGAIEYIIEGNINCLGWSGVGSFPADRAALEWTPISE